MTESNHINNNKKKNQTSLLHIYSYHIFKIDIKNKIYEKDIEKNSKMISIKYDFLWIIMQPSHLFYRARHTLYIYIRILFAKLFFSNNISLLNITAYFTCANISRVSEIHFAKANIFFLQSGISLDVYFFFSFFLLDFLLARSTHRKRRCVDVDVDVVVSGAPLFKYKPKRRSGRFPVGASRCSWDRQTRQKAPTGLKRSAKKLYLSSLCVC